MKQGEQEAKMILVRKGVAFDDNYHDDNSRPSMPDFKYLDEECFLEVTHTLHNNAIVTKLNRFNQKSNKEQLEIMEKAFETYVRIRHANYSQTADGLSQFHSDLKTVKSHYGYDPTIMSFSAQHSEFKCDCPTIECSTDNILREVQEKGEKHKSGNTDLFIFVLEDEFKAMIDLLESGPQNGCYVSFCNAILQSPFPLVYICVWSWETQKYEVDNPIIMKFEKTDDGGLRTRRI